MSKAEEIKILERMSKNFRDLDSAELSKRIKKLPLQKRRIFEKPYQEKMRLAMQAEELLKEGRAHQAIGLLENALSLGFFGNEYPYGLLGDAYIKRGDRSIAREMYTKSGSTDSKKKIKTLGLEK